MTTPERLRRRQHIETALVIIVIIMTSLSTVYTLHQNEKIQTCLADNFADLSNALSVRADLASRETQASQRIWKIYAEAAGLVKNPDNPKLDPKDQRRINAELVDALLDYQVTIDQITRLRATHPVPPYPAGLCTR